MVLPNLQEGLSPPTFLSSKVELRIKQPHEVTQNQTFLKLLLQFIRIEECPQKATLALWVYPGQKRMKAHKLLCPIPWINAEGHVPGKVWIERLVRQSMGSWGGPKNLPGPWWRGGLSGLWDLMSWLSWTKQFRRKMNGHCQLSFAWGSVCIVMCIGFGSWWTEANIDFMLEPGVTEFLPASFSWKLLCSCNQDQVLWAYPETVKPG